MTDDELKSLLEKWPVPLPSAGLGERTEAALERARRPWWKRALASRINVPVPAAAAAFAGLVALATLFPRPVEPPRIVLHTRALQVPVVRERVVTRTVYVPVRPAEPTKRMALLFGAFEPVREMKPEIIRRSHAR